MTKTRIAAWAFAAALGLLAVVAGAGVFLRRAAPLPAPRPSPVAPPGTGMPEPRPGFLYGRVTTVGGVTYEGRLRWGGTQEAFWGDYFNGVKTENSWAARVPPDRLPKEHVPIEILGVEFGTRERPVDLERLFMARFGDIARVSSQGRDVQVTLKSGAVFHLDRWKASDFDDGVRVWDATRGAVDLDSLQIRTIEFLPTAPLSGAPERLHGTVRTKHGDFTGFVQWDREECTGDDTLDGRAGDGEISLRFDTIRSIARRPGDGCLVTPRDGREVVLSGTRDAGQDNRGLYVDDPRYGRVLIPWDAFERVEFSPADSGPAYDDFPPGHPLTGSVTTRDGRHLAGRLVFDLDESETTETLDAPAEGIDYTIPFGLVASIALPADGSTSARVTLHGGEQLSLERKGDLGERNGGMLVFVEGRKGPEYVPWSDVEKIDLERPPAMYPPARHEPGGPTRDTGARPSPPVPSRRL